MVYVLLAPGFEESEAIVPTDLLRQGGLETALVSLSGPTVTGGHNITVRADLELSQVDLDQAEMIVLASPVYYHSFSGQLQCAINRIYALDKPKYLKKAALILSSGSDHVYSGAIYEYQNSFLNYLHLEDMGIFTAYGKENRAPEKLEELYRFGKSLPKE